MKQIRYNELFRALEVLVCRFSFSFQAVFCPLLRLCANTPPGFVFNGQTQGWCQSFHLTLGKKANKRVFPKCRAIPWPGSKISGFHNFTSFFQLYRVLIKQTGHKVGKLLKGPESSPGCRVLTDR